MIESLCKFVKVSMRSMSHLFNPYLPSYIAMIDNNMKTHPLSSYIYSCETIVCTYGKIPEWRKEVEAIFNIVMERFLPMLMEGESINQKDPDIGRQE